jgi:kynureninase
VKAFIGAGKEHEIIFTRGTTESINLVAYSFGQLLDEGDLILVSQLEHHSNFVPWQMLAERRKLRLKFIPMNEAGELDQKAFLELLKEKPRLVAFNHVSNSLGTIHPVKEMIKKAHAAGAVVVLARRPWPTCLSTFRNWMPIFTLLAHTKCAAPPDLAYCTARKNGSMPCLHSWAEVK